VKPLIIAIDGPAGAGKSTLASRLAARFGLLNLETGAMYRAFALKALETQTDLNDPIALEKLATTTLIRLEPTVTGNRVLLDGTEVTTTIRQTDVTEAASRISVYPGIRRWMVEAQRALGENCGQASGVVMEGRDIGTAVFPDATIKIFLDADPAVRGQRRFEQMGPKAAVAQEAVLKDIRDRDERDSTRGASPLQPAPGAIIIDSSRLTLDEVVAQAEAAVTAQLGADSSLSER
jgi:CMP/dCMP kinase